MFQFCKSADGKYMSDAGLKEIDEKKKEVARNHLIAYPRMLRLENQNQCLRRLDDLMDIKYKDFKETINKQNKDFMLKKVVTVAGVGTIVVGAISLLRP